MNILILIAVFFSVISLGISLYSLIYIRKTKDAIREYSETVDEEFHLGFEEP